MEPLRTRNIKTDSELESQTSRFLPILISNHHIGEKLQNLGQLNTRPALREWLTCEYPISHQAAPATANQRRIWDLQSLPVDTTWGASKLLFTGESGSLTGGLRLDGGIGEFPADGLKAKHLGSAWTVVITIAPKEKKQTPHYLLDAHRPLIESLGSFPYDWCASCLGCFRTTSGSYIFPLSTDNILSDKTYWARWIMKSTCQNWWRRRILWTRPSITHCGFLNKVSPTSSCQTIRAHLLHSSARCCVFVSRGHWLKD